MDEEIQNKAVYSYFTNKREFIHSFIRLFLIHPSIPHSSTHLSFIHPSLIHPSISHSSTHPSFIHPSLIHPSIPHSSTHPSLIDAYFQQKQCSNQDNHEVTAAIVPSSQTDNSNDGEGSGGDDDDSFLQTNETSR